MIELLFSLFQVEAVEDSQEKNSDQSPKLDNSLDILKKYSFLFNLHSYMYLTTGGSGSVYKAHVIRVFSLQNTVLVSALKEY
jgi:hypothetical protein